MSCAKTAELIEKPGRVLTHVGPRNHVFDGINIGRDYGSPMRSLTKLIFTSVCHTRRHSSTRTCTLYRVRVGAYYTNNTRTFHFSH